MEKKKIQTPMPVGIVFLILGLIIAFVLGSTIHRLHGDNMTQINGTIVDYESTTYKGNTQYYAVYEYEWNGETGTYRDLSAAQNTNEIGKTVKLYYNTESNCVEAEPQILYFITGSLIFSGIGIALIAYSIKLKKENVGI